MASVRTRLAPSPTGDPHIGTLFQALFGYAYAKKHQGQFIVRIEDTDKTRQTKGAETAIFKALDWLDLTPDESPQHGGQHGPYRQSQRLKIYQQHAMKLVDKNHAYYCFCSQERLDKLRKSQQKSGQPPMYDQKCRSLKPQAAKQRAQQEPHVIRMKIPDKKTIIVPDLLRGKVKFDSQVLDDQVILKSDGFPTYHLAVVVDDHLMKITHMIRGEEWLSSAPKHILLYQYFNWQPPKFIHTPLLRNPDRSKLSKRHGHATVNWYLQQGYLKEAVINFLATRVWNHPKAKEVFSLQDLIKHFKFKAMHIQGPIVDIDKLNWLNGQWIRQLPDKTILKRLADFKPKNLSSAQLKLIWPLIKQRIEYLSQLKDLTEYFVKSPKIDKKLILKESKLTPQKTADYLKQVSAVIKKTSPWSVKALETDLHQLQEKSGLKPRPAFMTIRLAITGRPATPPLFDTLKIIGQSEVIKRLTYAQTSLNQA